MVLSETLDMLKYGEYSKYSTILQGQTWGVQQVPVMFTKNLPGTCWYPIIKSSVSDSSHLDVDPDPDPGINIWEKCIRILGSTFP